MGSEISTTLPLVNSMMPRSSRIARSSPISASLPATPVDGPHLPFLATM